MSLDPKEDYKSAMGANHPEVCPFAQGFVLQELDCALVRNAEARLPWWRRLLHMLRGDYCCYNMGSLPCARYKEHLSRLKEER